jgi:transcription antitermination factor NusA-like protein
MDQYINTLKECNIIAKSEYKRINSKLNHLKAELTQSQNTLLKTILSLDDSSIKNKDVHIPLQDVNDKTTKLLSEGFDHFENSFLRKKQNLSDFTITLFGRTKAGKSTIREALTNGDGSTIGKGAQRTTRDIKEYRWNKLRIIDTPGFDAFEGEEDEKIALEQLDTTDLILFLITSDSIEESEFEKLAKIRRENKPVIILLNILYDLSHPVKKKLFLKDPNKYVSVEAISGHLNRLKFLSKKHFDVNNIKVIPIHALSAYLSNNANNDEKQQLYNASNFKYFNDYIVKEIQSTGKLKRVQSFRDSYIFHLENNIKSVYDGSYQSLKPVVNLLRLKQKHLQKWFDMFIQEKNTEIEHFYNKLYDPLFNQLDDFVERNIDKDNFNEMWSSKIQSHLSESKIITLQEKIIADANRYLEEFFKEFKFDLNLCMTNIEINLKSVKKEYTGTSVRWVTAGTGTASAIILSTMVANSWNPLGWGLAAVSIGLGIFSWIYGDDSKRFSKQKATTKTSMRNILEKHQLKNHGMAKTWFYETITKGLKKKITQELNLQVKQFDLLLKEYYSISNNLENTINKENFSLVERLIEVQKLENYANIKNVKKIIRKQGNICKVIIDKPPLFITENYKQLFEQIMGEQIHEVQYSFDETEFLLNALNINKIDIIDVSYNQVKKCFKINAKKQIAGKLFGSKGINIRLAEKIINKKIIVNLKE